MQRTAVRIVLTAIAIGILGSAHAQDSGVMREQASPEQSSASADEQILAGFEKARKDGEGLVIVGAGFEGLSCPGIEFYVARVVDGRVQKVAMVGVSKFLGSVIDYRPRGLAAGEWMLTAVKCRSGGSQTFNGPYAKFTVPGGGIVDAGFLKINYQPEEFPKRLFTAGATIRLSVTPTPEFRLAELRKRIPRVMALVKKQPMVLTVPVEQKVKPMSPF